jgi:hypothetical protein
VKLAQLGSIVCKKSRLGTFLEDNELMVAIVITVYGVLFLDWKQENPPFQGVCFGVNGKKYCADVIADSQTVRRNGGLDMDEVTGARTEPRTT